MLRIERLASVAALALAMAGCASMSVSSHFARGLDFSQYRTFDWGPADALPTGDPRLDKDPFFQDQVQGAIEKQLAARGFKSVAASEQPDLLIHYHASIRQRFDVNRADQEYGYCYGDDCTIPIVGFEAGTLVLDIVDRRTNRVIWRGWAQDSLDDTLHNREKMRRRINEAVSRMLASFPPA
jgi:hypothetical protein